MTLAKRAGIHFLFFLATLTLALAQKPQLASLEELEKNYPGTLTAVLRQIDLSQPELSQVKKHFDQNHPIKAGYALLDYYQNSKKFPWLLAANYESASEQLALADAAIANTFTLQGITSTQKKTSTGNIDWDYLGPKNDSEWGWMLNRHLWFLDYIGSWSQTKNPKYPRAFNQQIADWILTHPAPPLWGTSNSPSWRALEVGRRLYESWPPAFYSFQNAPEFSPATRILMLQSIHTQAEYCRKNLSNEGNHRNTELLGLAAAATYWSEFKQSKQWVKFAVAHMRDELALRVYPDGSQMELSNHYQIVVATHCQTLANLLRISDHPAAKEFEDLSQKLWSYTRLVMKPDGNGPLNNDCETERNSFRIFANQSRSLSIQKNSRTGIHTLSTNPLNLPSTYFPWAGQAIMRGTKQADADWLFFDVGPLGTAHQHYDTLNLAIFSGGRDILVDAGRYTYKPGKWRRYFTGQPAHNIILFNGGGENEDPRQSRRPIDAKWISRPEFNFATGNTTIRIDSWLGNDRVKHTRSILYVRDQYWLVIDQIYPTKSYKIEVPWHFHPDCTVELKDGNIIETTDKNKGNLRIIPFIPESEKFQWKTQIIKGQTTPTPQGWYSPNYNIKQPSPVAIYELKNVKDFTYNRPITFAWLIIPGKDIPSNYQTKEIPYKIDFRNRFKLEIQNVDKKKSDLVEFEPQTLDNPKPKILITLSGKEPIEIQ